MVITNDISYSKMLEDYFYNLIPPIVWKTYNCKTEKVYINVNLQQFCKIPIGFDTTHWYFNNCSHLPDRVLYRDDKISINEIMVRLKRKTIDVTCITTDKEKNQELAEYIKHVEGNVKKKIQYAMFTYCDSGITLQKHKDTTDIQKNRIHHVLLNGGVSSIIFYNDQLIETSRINGQRGDVFSFDAEKVFHNFERPISPRLHFIMSTED